MQSADAIELAQQAIFMALLIGAPLLLVGVVVGFVIGLLQALTQVQDQTLNAVPKIVAMVIALLFCLPWIADRLIDYTRENYQQIPSVISQSRP